MTKKKTQQFNVRLTPTLWEWFHGLCVEQGWKKTRVVEEYLEALREGRVSIRPRGPDAFPAETVLAGKSPDFPILIGLPPEPDDLLRDAFPAEVAHE